VRTKSNGDVIVVDRNLLSRKLLVRDPQGHTRTIDMADVQEVLGKAAPSAMRQDPSSRLAALSNAPNERVATLAANMRSAMAAEQQQEEPVVEQAAELISNATPYGPLEDEPARKAEPGDGPAQAEAAAEKPEENSPKGHHSRRQRFHRNKPHHQGAKPESGSAQSSVESAKPQQNAQPQNKPEGSGERSRHHHRSHRRHAKHGEKKTQA